MIEAIKWGLTAVSIGGAILVGPMARPLAGHRVWVWGNAGWVAVWGLQGEHQAAVLFSVYFVIALFGIRRWRG
jgi:hypothetical protein